MDVEAAHNYRCEQGQEVYYQTCSEKLVIRPEQVIGSPKPTHCLYDRFIQESYTYDYTTNGWEKVHGNQGTTIKWKKKARDCKAEFHIRYYAGSLTGWVTEKHILNGKVVKQCPEDSHEVNGQCVAKPKIKEEWVRECR